MELISPYIKERFDGLDKKRAIAASAVIFLAILSIFIYLSKNNSGDVTGKTIENQGEMKDVKFAAETEAQSECSINCNSDNILQFCSSGKWSNCPSGKVCSLGKCVIPEKTAVKSVSGGGGGSSESETITTTTIARASQSNTYELGQIETEKTIDVAKGDITKFSIGGVEYSIKLEDNTLTQATINIDSKTFNLKVGDSQTAIDINSDENTDFFVKLKSVSVINNKISLVIRK